MNSHSNFSRAYCTGQLSRAFSQSVIPDSIHRRNTSTFSVGQAPSQGIVPLSSRLRISVACVRTSPPDQRSNTKLMDSRSILRKSGLICWAKVTGSSRPGRATGCTRSGGGAIAETLDPGVALQTHHQRGTGICGGGIAHCWEFSLPIREPHSR